MKVAKVASLLDEMMESGFGGKTVGTDTSVAESVEVAMSRLAITDEVAVVTVDHEGAGVEYRPSPENDGDLQNQVSGAVQVQAGPARAVSDASVHDGSDARVCGHSPGVTSDVPVAGRTVRFSGEDSAVSVKRVEDANTTRSTPQLEGDAGRMARDDGWDIWRECTLHQMASQLERNFVKSPLHDLTDSLQEVVDLVIGAPDVQITLCSSVSVNSHLWLSHWI